MFCTACGTANRDGTAFCTNCGKPLKEGGTAAAPPAATPARYAFASDARVPVAEVDYSAIAAAGVTKASPLGNVRINKKFVKSATDEQLAAVIVAWTVQGAKEKFIVKTLVKQGVPPAKASDLQAKVRLAVESYEQTPEGRKVLLKKYRRQMIGGVAWFAGGTLVTVGTFAMAAPGGSYFVAYGAVVWGLVAFIQGLVRWRKVRSD